MNKVSVVTVSLMIAGALLLPLQGSSSANTVDQIVSPQIQSSHVKAKRIIDEAVKYKNIPGVIFVSSNKGSKWSYASGEASIYDNRPVKTNFTFRIGSITKTFVATVVLQLVDEQKLNLDDTVEKWLYSNTNTVLAGMIVEKVTGQTYDEQIRERFIGPLKLSNTYVADDFSFIPGEHARGYHKLDGKLIDRTETNPSWANAAGSMISTGDDLNTFFIALLGGKLLEPSTLEQMLTGVETPVGNYGLGIMETKLANGVTIWGHGGNTPGFATFTGGTLGGDYVQTVNINVMPSDINTLTLSKSIAEQLIKSSSK
ncbi:hypothetical protein L3i20_v233740 [Paenibacillus sp. L3-i20]|nr:hypothetical protein L3i20_v233740 [Paenibacillus sp. L3-i20]